MDQTNDLLAEGAKLRRTFAAIAEGLGTNECKPKTAIGKSQLAIYSRMREIDEQLKKRGVDSKIFPIP
jgi:hypothetical protein